MKIFITGEAGLIAQYLDKILADYVVWGYNHRDLSKCTFPNMWGGDVELDIMSSMLYSVISELMPDVVIHPAGVVNTDMCDLYPELAVDINIIGALNIATISSTIGAKLVYFSTTAVFDPDNYGYDRMITNRTRKSPRTLYGMTKMVGEHMVKRVMNKKKLLILRPCFVYGGYSDHHSSLMRIIRAVKYGEDEVNIDLNPHYYKDYMYVDDAVNIMKGLIVNNVVGEYNISRGKPRIFFEYVETIKRGLGKLPKINYFPEKDYLHNHIVDGSTAIKDSDYIPRLEFNEEMVHAIFEEV